MSDISFIVCMGASRSNKLMPKYLQQLESANISYHVMPLSITSPSDGKLGWCIDNYRNLAQQFSNYDRIILTDAWDVLCYATRDQIEKILPRISPQVMFAAERNCYPEPNLSFSIKSWIGEDVLWCYLNGGMLTASPQELLNWCDAVQNHPAYDPFMIGQQWLNRRLAEKSDLVWIDWSTELFYCMFMEDQKPTLENKNGRPHNTYTGEFPSFIHFNGSWPPEPFLRMMGEKV